MKWTARYIIEFAIFEMLLIIQMLNFFSIIQLGSEIALLLSVSSIIFTTILLRSLRRTKKRSEKVREQITGASSGS